MINIFIQELQRIYQQRLPAPRPRVGICNTIMAAAIYYTLGIVGDVGSAVNIAILVVVGPPYM